MGKTEVKREGGQNLFALCNRHESDRSQMKDKGEKKWFAILFFMNKIFQPLQFCQLCNEDITEEFCCLFKSYGVHFHL